MLGACQVGGGASRISSWHANLDNAAALQLYRACRYQQRSTDPWWLGPSRRCLLVKPLAMLPTGTPQQAADGTPCMAVQGVTQAGDGVFIWEGGTSS